MMSARFVAVCAVGLVGSLFIGYCVYFDRKRRRDPDYKKKVLARRKTAAKKSASIDLRDPKVREEFLMTEMTKANQKISEGKIEEAVGHFINFVHFSGNPRGALMSLQQQLPTPLFNILLQAYAVLQEDSAKRAKKEETDVD